METTTTPRMAIMVTSRNERDVSRLREMETRHGPETAALYIVRSRQGEDDAPRRSGILPLRGVAKKVRRSRQGPAIDPGARLPTGASIRLRCLAAQTPMRQDAASTKSGGGKGRTRRRRGGTARGAGGENGRGCAAPRRIVPSGWLPAHTRRRCRATGPGGFLISRRSPRGGRWEASRCRDHASAPRRARREAPRISSTRTGRSSPGRACPSSGLQSSSPRAGSTPPTAAAPPARGPRDRGENRSRLKGGLALDRQVEFRGKLRAVDFGFHVPFDPHLAGALDDRTEGAVEQDFAFGRSD